MSNSFDLEAAIAAAYVAVDNDDVHDAIRQFAAIAEAVPDDPRPHAELAHLWALAGDIKRGLRHADQALELCEEEDELIACVLQKADLHLQADTAKDRRAAHAALSELSTSALEDADRLAVADAYLGCSDHAAALRTLQGVQDPALVADADLLRGLAHDQAGDEAARNQAWRSVLHLDAAEPRPVWALPPDEIQTLATNARNELAERAQQLLADVPIVLADAPAVALVSDGVDPRTLGLFVGAGHRDRGTATEPTAIFVFVRNLERICESADEFREQLFITVVHETAHYFGLDDDALDALGLG